MNRNRGITLIELMIVVVIVGILAAIAYPSYRDQALRSGRTEGKATLEARALALERCYTQFMSYNNAACAAAQAAANGLTGEGRYNVTIGNLTATTFTLTATPAGGQVGDAACGALSIDERGQRTAATGNNAQCW